MIFRCNFPYNIHKLGEGQYSVVVRVSLDENLPDPHAYCGGPVQHSLRDDLQGDVQVHQHSVWVKVAVVLEVRVVAQQFLLDDQLLGAGLL